MLIKSGNSSFLTSFDRNLPTSLYLHIPFCRAKCDYCSFYSLPVGKESDEAINNKVRGYARRLILEASEALDYFGRPFETVFIGGGTPDILTRFPEELEGLISLFKGSKEVTLEGNPSSEFPFYLLDGEVVNRISLGIESLDHAALMNIGRNSVSEQDIFEALYFLHLNSVSGGDKAKNFNFDLIANIPGAQTSEINVIERLMMTTWPPHISLYSLSLEEGTPLHRRAEKGEFNPLSEDEEADNLTETWAYLKRLGFRHYEISNFALPGYECLHNQRYWRLEQYMGLGSTAASRAMKAPGDGMTGWRGSRDAFGYPTHELFSDYEKEEISPKEEAVERILTGLRTDEGIKHGKILERTGVDLQKLVNFEPDVNECLWDGEGFVLNEKGMLVADSYIERLTEQLL